MSNRTSATALAAMMIVSMFAGFALANDANTGGDAGGSTSTAAWLPSNSSTYYGNLSSSDTDDYYGFNMSNSTAITVGLTSPSGADYDLWLYSSSGSQLDTSFTTGYDEVSSNGTSVGGTTVYVRVEQFSGSGQYTMQVWISNTSTGGGGGGGNNSTGSGHDAGTGTDAGGSTANAMQINATNVTFWGNVHSSNDADDYYSISIPSNYGINASLDWNGTSTSPDLDLLMYDSSGSIITYSYYAKPENVSSAGHGGTTVFLRVNAYLSFGGSAYSSDYSLRLDFSNMSTSPINNQNDSGSGGDAGNDVYNSTAIQTSPGVNDFTGWMSVNGDSDDFYVFSVPNDHGIAINLSSNPSDLVAYIIIGYESNLSTIDYSTNLNGNEDVTSNGSVVQGESILLRVVAYTGEGFYNFTVNMFSLDADGDGWWDSVEVNCGTDPNDYNDVPVDTDADGICDGMDADDDADGYDDYNDTFPLDPNEWTDTDSDGVGDNADEDDDGDGWSDSMEYQCNSDPLYASSVPSDIDSDGTCDVLDDDDDADGYLDTEDAFPLDPSEWLDTDSDGIGDNSDEDDDGDGFADATEVTCGSDPLISNSVPTDTDLDGSCDAVDGDDDNDGFPDSQDQFPLDPSEWVDTDGDSIGDNTDEDDDGDGWIDSSDVFPLDNTEWVDNDNDGMGDNSDEDDDNDGWSDSDEQTCGSDQYSQFSQPDDFDSDQTCDVMDADDDNDGVPDADDMFQFDVTEWTDTDFDSIGDNADDDDDGDGWSDTIEPNCGTDPMDANSIPLDTDADNACDPLDPDDDNDMVPDVDDAFPLDTSESMDTDGDGIGNNADNDDDGDTWTDSSEVICLTEPLSASSVPIDTDSNGACDVIDPDNDGDGVVDESDAFPLDPNEWEDRNKDGLGDNAYPLTLGDKMKLNPGLTALGLIVVLAAVGGTVAMVLARNKKDEVWKDDSYDRYEKQEAAFDAPAIPDPPERPPDLAPAVEEPSIPDPPERPPDLAPAVEEPSEPEMPPLPEATPSPPHEKSPPPPPPGFEDVAPEPPQTVAATWEELPDGGDYVMTEPMTYVGEECGTWEQQPDESWRRL